MLWSLALARHAEQGVAVPEGLFQRRLRTFPIQILRSLREPLRMRFLSAGVDRMILPVQGSQQGRRVQRIRGFADARSVRGRRPGQGEGFHPSVVQDALPGGEVKGKLPSSLVEVLLSFLVPTPKEVRWSVSTAETVPRATTTGCRASSTGTYVRAF